MDFPSFRKNFTTKELATYMLKEFNIDEDVVARLIDEEIDGLAFLELEESDLRELGIRKMGTLKKLLLLIRQASEQSASATTSKQTTTQNPDLRSAVLDVMKSLNQLPNNQPSVMRPAISFSSATTKPMIVQQNSRSGGYMGQIGGSYATTPPISMTARAVKSAKIPSVVKPSPTNALAPQRVPPVPRSYRWQEKRAPPALIPALESTRSQRKPLTPQRYVSASDAGETSHESPSDVKIEPTSPRSDGSEITQVKSGDLTPETAIPLARGVDTIADQVANAMAESRQLNFATESPYAPHGFRRIHDDDEDEELPQKFMKYMAPDQGKKSTKLLDSYELADDATFESIDLGTEIAKMPGGQDIVNVMKREGRNNNLFHRRFMKKAVHILELVSQKMGFRKYYPPNYVKVIMAKKIVTEFPLLGYNEAGKAAHTTYFDASDRSGFIENRLKTLRRSLNIEDKAYKPRAKGKHGGYQDYEAAASFNVVTVPENFDIRSESGDDTVESYAASEGLGPQSLEEVDGCEKGPELDQMFNTFFKD